MAMINEILTARYNSLLHKLLGMKGSEPAPQLAPEIIAYLGIEVDRPEWFWLRDKEFLSSASAAVTSAAGTAAEVFIFNPVGSGKLVVVTRLSFTISAAGINRAYLTTVPGAMVTTLGNIRDLRQPGTTVGSVPRPAVSLLSAAKAAPDGIGVDQNWQTPAAGTVAESILGLQAAIILPPGFGVGVQATGVGIATLVANFDWYERALEPQETS
jgi:hypothetical protein